METISAGFPEQTVMDARPSVILPGTNRVLDQQNLVIAAVKGGDSDTLRLIAYRRDGGQLLRVAHSAETGRIVGTPAVCYFGGDKLVTATHGENSNRLFLISWRIEGSGDDVAIERKGDSGSQLGTPSGTADLAWIGGDRIALAARTEGGDLKLFAFDIHGQGNFQRVSDSGSAAGRITAPPSLAYVGPPGKKVGEFGQDNGLPTPLNVSEGIVVTAVRSSTGRLKLISWNAASDRVHRLADTGNAGISIDDRPAIAVWPNRSIVAVAARRGDHHDLSAWQVDERGRFSQARRESAAAGMVGSPAMTFLPHLGGTGRVAVAATSSDGGLIVDLWDIDTADGPTGELRGLTFVERGRTGSLGAVGSPGICPSRLGLAISSSNPAPDVYTGVRLGSRRLALHRWS